MTLISAPLRGEIIPPGQGLRLRVRPNPFRRAFIEVEAPAGLTLADLAERATSIAGSGFRFRFVASISGERVAEVLWHRVRPKPGTVVLMQAVPGFENDNQMMKTLVAVAAIAASIFIPGIGPLVGAAISIGGSLLVDSLFPIPKPQLAIASDADNGAASSQAYSIAGGQNAPRPYGVIPEVLGRHRVYLDLGADWFTDNVGAEQFLVGVLVAALGPKELSDWRIGETPLADFADVQTEIREGYPGDAPLSLYPYEAEQEDLSIDISVAGGAQQRTTGADIDSIGVDVVAPGGILRVDANGAAEAYAVLLRVDYRPAAGGAWSLLGTLSLVGRSRDQIRTGLLVGVVNGQYDVRITKTSADANSDQVLEQVVWTTLRTFKKNEPILFSKPLAKIALRIRATSQLNGVIDQLNVIVATRCTAFNGAVWVADTVSNNPADLFRYVLQGPANARPLPDAKINIDNLERWWAYCDDKGFAFNMVRDFRASVYETLTAVASAGRAAVSFTDGLWDVIWDDPDAPVVQHFTPRNSWDFTGDPTYVTLPHAWRVRFINEDRGYAQDERVVYDDGYNEGNATLFEEIEFPGVTDSNLIWKFGRFHIAQARLRPETYTLNTDFEHLVATRGDRVRVTHDVPLWGGGAGRVIATGVDGDNDTVDLDEQVTMEAGTDYSIRFRLADGSSVLRSVITDDGTATSIVLDGHGDLPEAGDLWMFGALDSETVVLRILRIEPGADFTAKLTLVDDAPAISLADQGAIPAFDSQITIPVDPFTAAPIDLTVQEAFEGIEGATATGALLSWETVAGASPAFFEVEYRDDDGDGVWKPAGTVWAPTKAKFIPGLLQGLWSFHVRSVFEDGTFSRWAELANTTITAGGELELPDVTNLVMSFKDSTSALTWDEVKYSRLDVRYEIRKGDDWESALVIGVDIAHPPFTTYGNETYWVAAKAQPLPGVIIYSANPVSLTVAGSILVRNVLSTLDEGDNGWTGALSGAGVPVIDGATIRTTVANEIGYYELDPSRFFDLGRVGRVRIEASWKAIGVPETQNILDDPDFLNNPDVLSAGSSQYIEAWPEIATAGEVDADVFAGSDVFAAADVFAGSLVFGDYVKFAPGEYQGRHFKLRMALRSNDASVYAALINWTITSDVPDRVDHLTNYALSAAGETFNFTPDGTVDAKPFKGGPGTAIVPNVQVTWTESDGDYLVISALSLSSVTIRIFNGGAGVARTISAIFQGW